MLGLLDLDAQRNRRRVGSEIEEGLAPNLHVTVLNLSSHQFPSPDDDHEHDDRDTVDDEEAEAAAALPEARGQVPRDQDSLHQNQGTGCSTWS